MMGKSTLYDTIREEVREAARSEAAKKPFALSGRGHEPRVTLNRQVAAILRSTPLPHVNISGFGANNFYPRRVFVEAGSRLASKLGSNPLRIDEGFVSGSVYLDDA